MAMPIQPEDLDKLRKFIKFVGENPRVLQLPELNFVKNFIESFGGKIPDGGTDIPSEAEWPFSKNKQPGPNNSNKQEEAEAESEESELELDMSGVIEPDTDFEQTMGDINKQPTEEEMAKSGELRVTASAKYSEQNYTDAIKCYTDAIILNPGNALFYAKRGQAFLKLNKPNCCIRDCDRALEINCDSAAAYKFRGRARRLLGDWIEAVKDLRQACKLDFDEEADQWLREVTPNAKKIEQHQLKQQRRKAERERKAREADMKNQRQQQHSANDSGNESMNMGNILHGMKDPEVMNALRDILQNPSNIDKYKSNPKISSLIDEVKHAFPGGIPGCEAGFPGAFSGAFPGAFVNPEGARDAKNASGTNIPSAQTEAKQPSNKTPDFVDDGLD